MSIRLNFLKEEDKLHKKNVRWVRELDKIGLGSIFFPVLQEEKRIYQTYMCVFCSE